MHGTFSEESLAQFTELVSQTQSSDFSEGDTYDFTRCVRPDGSAYGTRGKCRKGSEVGPAEKPAPKGGAAAKSAPAGGGVEKIKEKLKNASPEEKKRVAQAVQKKVAESSQAPAAAPKRKLATSTETRDAWRAAEKVVKEARANYESVRKETKGDKSPAARKKLLTAAYALDKAERAATKASDKFGAALKRESRKAMTPAQKKEEREWNKFKKQYG